MTSLLELVRRAGIAGALVLGCHADAPAPEPSTHPSRHRGLLAADALLGATITALGEPAALSAWLADDGVELLPDAPLRIGAAAVRAGQHPAGAVAERLHLVAGDVSDDGQLGYTFGWFDDSSGGFGKYLAAWRRVGLVWQIAAWVHLPGKRPPSAPPAHAAILAGERGTAAPGDPATLRDQVFAADRAFSALSVARGYTVAFTTYAAADAVIVGGSDLFWNAAGVARALDGWTPLEELAWAPRAGRAASSGDLAFTVGEATFTSFTGIDSDRSYTKYLTVWIRQPDGSWRFLVDGGNASPPP